MFFLIFFFFSVFFYAASYEETLEKKTEQKELPKIGNFILPTSQQPGPLLSFGQRILDKNQTQLFLFGDDVNGAKKHMIDVALSIMGPLRTLFF